MSVAVQRSKKVDFEAKVRRLADVQPEALNWLWPNRLPCGKFTLMVGDPGSQLAPFCNLVVLRSHDLDRAGTFYSALGLNFVRHSHGNGPEHLASESNSQVFEVYPLSDGELPTTSTRIGFAVPSVDEAYTGLLAAGGQSVSQPKDSPWGRRAVVADPDGHRVELLEKAAETV